MPKYYELIDKRTGAVVFRGSTTQILEGAGITHNTWDSSRAVGTLWGRYLIKELSEAPAHPLPFIEPEEPKKEEPKPKKRQKVIHRTSSSVWYTYQEGKK